jgi:hypothetical protein
MDAITEACGKIEDPRIKHGGKISLELVSEFYREVAGGGK